MTVHRERKLVVIALGVIVVLAGLSLAQAQTTTGLLIDDNETANATFSVATTFPDLGAEHSYDGETVCVDDEDCPEEEDEALGGPPTGFDVIPPWRA